MSDTAESSPVLLAVVAEDRVTATLYQTAGGRGFLLETIVWPAVWGTRSRFQRVLTTEEARAWVAGHGVDVEMEADA